MLPLHTILHATDFSDHSNYALRLACSLARDYNARLVVTHVAMVPMVIYGEGVVPAEPESFLDQAKERLEHLEIPDVNVERRLVEGEPAGEIVRVAREIGADLIVMGTHGRSGLGRLLMGSVAEKVGRRAPCPVLTVRVPFPAEMPETEMMEELAHT